MCIHTYIHTHMYTRIHTCIQAYTPQIWRDSECVCTLQYPGSVWSLHTYVHTYIHAYTPQIWRDGECVCTLQHPGSVWSVTVTSEGDIATGCSDAVARVFTRSAERAAGAEAQSVYETRITSQTVSAREVRLIACARIHTKSMHTYI
jgi:hypothetical protein